MLSYLTNLERKATNPEFVKLVNKFGRLVNYSVDALLEIWQGNHLVWFQISREFL